MRRLAKLARQVNGLIVTSALLGALAAAGCGDKPSQADCNKLLDHVIDLEIQSAGTTGLGPEMKADLEKQRKEVKDYVAQKFLESCIEDTPAAVVKCGLAAKTKADYAACEKR